MLQECATQGVRQCSEPTEVNNRALEPRIRTNNLLRRVQINAGIKSNVLHTQNNYEDGARMVFGMGPRVLCKCKIHCAAVSSEYNACAASASFILQVMCNMFPWQCGAVQHWLKINKKNLCFPLVDRLHWYKFYLHEFYLTKLKKHSKRQV